MGYSRSKIVDADNHDRVIAFTEGQGVSIGTPPEAWRRCPRTSSRSPTRPTCRPCGRCSAPPVAATATGRCPSSPPNWPLRTPPCTSGRSTSLLETAAIDLAADLVGTDRLQMQTWHVMFLARGKIGPFRVDGEAVRGPEAAWASGWSSTTRATSDRQVTSASALFQVVE